MRPGIKLKIFTRSFTIFFPLVLFYSCTEKKTYKQPVKKDTLVFATEEVKHIAKDTIQWVPDYPSDTAKYPARVLTAGGHHREEVDDNSDDFEWKGLFKGIGGYYVADTRVKLSLFDDIFDDDNKKPIKGWEVTPTVKDTAIILFSGIKNLNNRSVNEIILTKTDLLPGEQQMFVFKGIKYTLYATGDKKSDAGDKDSYFFKNYKMFIKTTIGGKDYNQLLVSIPRKTDSLGYILFAGDIDGDNIPDFVIDTAFHENAETTTLYLSGEAENGDLLKVVGLHPITGC